MRDLNNDPRWTPGGAHPSLPDFLAIVERNTDGQMRSAAAGWIDGSAPAALDQELTALAALPTSTWQRTLSSGH